MAKVKVDKTIVLSLGGSIIIPDKINVTYLKRFRSLMLKLNKRGYRFIIVTGGGDICRHYQKAARLVRPEISSIDLDWIGISATKYNAELIRAIFGSQAHRSIITNPLKKAKTGKKIIIGSGWKPGCSSDKDAVLLAKTYGAKKLINLSNIRFVYTADPKKNKNAKPIRRMSWRELIAITGRKWQPGAHVPFDPEASKVASRMGLEVVICSGKDMQNLNNIITKKRGVGTIIK